MTADIQFWDKRAEEYSKRAVANPEAFERKIAATLELMSPRDVVLDVGCGTGSLALRLSPHAGQVHGIDASAEMIRIAQAKSVGNTTFHLAAFDSRFTAFKPESLDGICAFSILHLLPDPEAAIALAYSLLKPGGFFVSSTACLGESWIPFRPILGAMRWMGRAPHANILRKRDIVRLLEHVGFTGVNEPSVGAESHIGFFTATKPNTSPKPALTHV